MNDKLNSFMNKKNHDFIKAVIASLMWTLLTSLFGLTQVWVTIVVSYVRIDKSYSFWAAFQDGSLLFFVMALVTAITIDYNFSENLQIPQALRSLVFTVTPLIIGILSIGVYVSLYTADEGQLDYESLANIQIIIIILTWLYALGAKFLIFFNKEPDK
ncbi:MAG: hypothetical protein ACPGWR_09900 [Ardenticatenaceae bacterium]